MATVDGPDQGAVPPAGPVAGALRVFYSYAHEDESLCAALRTHLAPMRREGVITDWWDRDIAAGAGWDSEISGHLSSSNIVIALLSSHFVDSDYAYGRELATALDLHQDGLLTLVPVIARPCQWQRLPIGALQALPANGRPVTRWRDRDSAYLSIADGLERVAQQLLAERATLLSDWLTSRLLRGRVIRAVQEGLAARDLYHGPIDGVPGPMTERAVRVLQQQGGVPVDGRIGPDVITLLARPPTGSATTT